MNLRSGRVITFCLFLAITGSFCELVSQTTSTKKEQPGKEGSQEPCKPVRTSPAKPSDGPLVCGPQIVLVKDDTAAASNIVQLRVVADKRGRVILAEPFSGDPALYERAVELAKRKRFKPKVLSGRRVKTEMILKLVFPLPESEAVKPSP